jgi:hypothetical protein
LLLGLEDIVVDMVHRNDDGVRVVTVHTAPEYVGRCTKCRTRSRRSRGWVTTRPRDQDRTRPATDCVTEA